MTADELVDQIKNAMAVAQQRVRQLIETYPGLYPLFTMGGHWKHNKPHWTNWCDGFLPGMMWLFLESGLADDPIYWRAMAEKYSAGLEARKIDKEVHTLGFIFYHGSHKRWYEATVLEGKADPAPREVVLQAARVLSQRYLEEGKFLKAFLGDDSMLVDVLMNLPLLFYGAAESGDERLRYIAMQTAWTARKTLVRGDSSVAQQAKFNIRSGEFLNHLTEQGYRSDSTWSRGLAWAMYGFVDCYEWSKEPRFLETAEFIARYFMEHVPQDGIPPWDFDAPTTGMTPRRQTDSSAAAISACALFLLAKVVTDPVRATAYRNAALTIVNTLTRPPFLVDQPKWEGILKGGVYHIHKDLGVDESVMWGDFYFVEAMNMALSVLTSKPTAKPAPAAIAAETATAATETPGQ
jgi:unsaturated chondroitin disaccharide hydrolase